MNEIIDKDGNVLRMGMAVVCQSEIWVIGSIDKKLLRLDRRTLDGRKESIFAGHRRWRQIHILGYQLPLVFS